MLHCLSGKENQLIQVIARHKNLRVQAITRIRIKPFSFAKPQAAGWDYNYYESHCFLLRQKQLKSLQMQFSFFFSHHRLKECKEVLHCWSGKENQLIQVFSEVQEPEGSSNQESVFRAYERQGIRNKSQRFLHYFSSMRIIPQVW